MDIGTILQMIRATGQPPPLGNIVGASGIMSRPNGGSDYMLPRVLPPEAPPPGPYLTAPWDQRSPGFNLNALPYGGPYAVQPQSDTAPSGNPDDPAFQEWLRAIQNSNVAPAQMQDPTIDPNVLRKLLPWLILVGALDPTKTVVPEFAGGMAQGAQMRARTANENAQTENEAQQRQAQIAVQIAAANYGRAHDLAKTQEGNQAELAKETRQRDWQTEQEQRRQTFELSKEDRAVERAKELAIPAANERSRTNIEQAINAYNTNINAARQAYGGLLPPDQMATFQQQHDRLQGVIEGSGLPNLPFLAPVSNAPTAAQQEKEYQHGRDKAQDEYRRQQDAYRIQRDTIADQRWQMEWDRKYSVPQDVVEKRKQISAADEAIKKARNRVERLTNTPVQPVNPDKADEARTKQANDFQDAVTEEWLAFRQKMRLLGKPEPTREEYALAKYRSYFDPLGMLPDQSGLSGPIGMSPDPTLRTATGTGQLGSATNPRKTAPKPAPKSSRKFHYEMRNGRPVKVPD